MENKHTIAPVVNTSIEKLEENDTFPIPSVAPTVKNSVEKLASAISSNMVYDGEKWVIDISKPPTISDAYFITNEVLKFKNQSTSISETTNWLLGNVIMVCRDYFKDEFDISEIGDITNTSYQTLITAESTYLWAGDRQIKGLSFTHHKEVHYMKDISEDIKWQILNKSKKWELTVKQQRKLGNLIKDEGPGVLFVHDDLEAINRIDAYKKEKEATFIGITWDKICTKFKESQIDSFDENHFRLILKLTPDLEVFKENEQAIL
jgi:hypothetical protein